MESDTQQLKKGLVSSRDNMRELQEAQRSGGTSGPAPTFFGLPTEHLEANSQARPPSPPSFWQVGYYKEYFDVSTKMILERTKMALWPFGLRSFVESTTKVDLYVPLWTLITLVISMSTFGSIMHALKTAHEHGETKLAIDFDASKITTVASVMSFYIVINPLLFFAALKCHGSVIGFAELLCLYGYSYVPFIPMSVLFVVQLALFQIVVLFFAAGLSTYFLYRNLGHVCEQFLGAWAYHAKAYMIILQVILVAIIYLKIYA